MDDGRLALCPRKECQRPLLLIVETAVIVLRCGTCARIVQIAAECPEPQSWWDGSGEFLGGKW